MTQYICCQLLFSNQLLVTEDSLSFIVVIKLEVIAVQFYRFANISYLVFP